MDNLRVHLQCLGLGHLSGFLGGYYCFHVHALGRGSKGWGTLGHYLVPVLGFTSGSGG